MSDTQVSAPTHTPGHDSWLKRLDEARPDVLWQQHFRRLWPFYRRWFLARHRGEAISLEASRKQLGRHMPELLPVWGELCELARDAGHGDLAARFLTLYRPPPFLTGCSMIATNDPVTGEPVLIRNYDYDPSLWERALWRVGEGEHRTVFTSDCLWGALDGVNARGLAVALSFGGRRVVGDGFGIPLIVRWLLDHCATVDEARNALARSASHMAYNLLLVDASGAHLVAELSPDRAPVFRDRRVVTNHQGNGGEWPEYERATATQLRRQTLQNLLDQDADSGTGSPRIAEAFLQQPLRVADFERSFVTLYTAVLRPRSGTYQLLWPGQSMMTGLDTPIDPAGERHPLGALVEALV